MTSTYPFPLLLLPLLILMGCDDDDITTPDTGETGTVEIEFENVFGPQTNQRTFRLGDTTDTDFTYANALDQSYRVTYLKYYISNIVLEGPDGERYEEPIDVTATSARGFHLVDATQPETRIFDLTDVPSGAYNRMSFTLGVDSTYVLEGAAGGDLDPVGSGMFWSWNAGYVAFKIEGQSPESPGGAHGNSLSPETSNGMVFHLGGWKDIEGTVLRNNNQRVIIDFDSNATVNGDLSPTIHFEFDVNSVFDGPGGTIDFGQTNVNMHSPVDANPLIRNAAAGFRYDHVHQ
ncbi:MAG: MbnP family protein [Lewinella sp.]